MENKEKSGWGFQLSYREQLVPAATQDKNHAKLMVDRFLKIFEDARVSAANSLTFASA